MNNNSKKSKQPPFKVQSPADASQVCGSELESFNSTTLNRSDDSSLTLTGNPDERFAEQSAPFIGKHQIFVLNHDENPLTPTTYAKAQKLIRKHLATRVWSKFGNWGIKLHKQIKTPKVEQIALGYDPGTKFEGFSILSGTENVLNIKLDLPDKSKISRKLEERRNLRRARRHRNCRRRKTRFNNRKRSGFIAPSQKVVVNSRLKILRELFKIYPISVVGLEDVRFNHAKKRWSKNFSTVEIGKSVIRKFFTDNRIRIHEFGGYETKELREKYEYRKISDKKKDVFEAHNCDSLALACEVLVGNRVEPCRIVVVDDSYRPVRRKLHDTQYAKRGVRSAYSRGTVFGLRKGKIVGYNGNQYILTGYQTRNGGLYTITDPLQKSKRNYVKRLEYISSRFIIRRENSATTKI